MSVRELRESVLVATCPLAVLSDQLAAASSELGRLEDQPKSPAVERRVGELFDIEDKLMTDAEYVTPTTAREAILTAVLMGRAVRAALASDEGDESPEKAMRRFVRLHARLLRYLSAEAAATVADLGLSDFHLDGEPITEA